MKSRAQSLVLALLLVLSGCRAAPPAAPPTERRPGAMLERTVNGARYAVWLPEGYDPARPWPVIVFLHGSGEWGTDGLRQTQVGLGPALRRNPERWPFIVLLPQKPDDESMWEDHTGLVFVELNEVRGEFHVDEDRIYLTGLSRGGRGTWAIAAAHPDAWAAIAPVCAHGDPALGAEVAMLPIWAFHGAEDDVNAPEQSLMLVEAARMERARRREAGLVVSGPEPRLTIYPQTNHNSWDRAYAEPDLPMWFLTFRRGAASP